MVYRLGIGSFTDLKVCFEQRSNRQRCDQAAEDAGYSAETKTANADTPQTQILESNFMLTRKNVAIPKNTPPINPIALSSPLELVCI